MEPAPEKKEGEKKPAILPTASVFPNGPFEGTAVAGTDNTDVSLGFDPAAFPVG